jgi:microtubule-associated protein-like 6
MDKKPWIDAAIAPSEPMKVSTAPTPVQELYLEWVHGFRSQGPASRGNAQYVKSGEIVFLASSLAVSYNSSDERQRFFTGHSDEVTCLAVRPGGTQMATGQGGGSPCVIMWDVATEDRKFTLHGHHHGAVHFLAFSPDGTKLATVGQDSRQLIVVHDSDTGEVLCRVHGGHQRILDVSFDPLGTTLAQCGVNHIIFHKISGGNVSTRTGLISQVGLVQPFLCIGWCGSDVVLGTTDGKLYKFDDRLLERQIEAHEGAITIMDTARGNEPNVPGIPRPGLKIVTGSVDGHVKIWGCPDLDPLVDLDIGALNTFGPQIRALCLSADGRKCLVGTISSELWEVNAEDGSALGPYGNEQPLLQGHCTEGGLHGLAVHPTKPEYVTVGDDMTVRRWDLLQRKQLDMVKLDCMARCVSYSPDGVLLVVGLGGNPPGAKDKDVKCDGPVGGFKIMNAEDLSVVHEARDSRHWIVDAKFSPDGTRLGVASYDKKIYFYDATPEAGFKAKGTFDRHKAALTHFDFSDDSSFLQSNADDGTLLFSDATTGREIPAPAELRDVDWANLSCTMGWAVQGAWPPYEDGTDVTAISRARGRQVLAVGDSFGRVKLYQYPCCELGAGAKTYRSHSGSVSQVRPTLKLMCVCVVATNVVGFPITFKSHQCHCVRECGSRYE